MLSHSFSSLPCFFLLQIMDTRKHTAAKCTQLQLPALTRGRGEKEGERRKEAVKTNTGPCLFGVSCCGASHVPSGFTHTSSLRCSLCYVFLFSVFAPHLALGFRSFGICCAYIVFPSSSSRQQFVVQPTACSFFPKMAAMKMKSALEDQTAFWSALPILPLSLFVRCSLSSPCETGDNSWPCTKNVAQCIRLVLPWLLLFFSFFMW